ncbi:hypothetical protein FQA39_LY05271 [Lamprigera yunnana]|nr:hypothetical protein FQA39_LY05271 [Lamprigera yunnana]
MCVYEQFLKELYKYLLNTEDIYNNVIKKHVRKLEQFGELSFRPTIPQFRNFSLDNLKENITRESKNWKLSICNCALKDNSYHFYIERSCTFQLVIKEILAKGSKYGSQKLNLSKNIEIRTDCDKGPDITLTQLRIVLLKSAVERFLHFNECNDDKSNTTTIYLEYNSNGNNDRKILCSPVLYLSDGKNVNISAEEFYKKRTVDMRLMAEHKYGLRITSNSGWQEIFKKLGEAAVTMELLQIKTNRSVLCKMNDLCSSCSKGASFILYNCARLSTLFREFHKRVDSKVYPPLPKFEDVNFTLLTEPEEWELLYVFMLQFPLLVQSCIKDIENNNIKIYNLCHTLASMSLTFSGYYQRVRILMVMCLCSTTLRVKRIF